MDNDTQKIIREALGNLPPLVRKAIVETDIRGALQKIAADNQLMIDQAGDLEVEVMMALIGLEEPSNLPKNLAKALNIHSSQAQKIAETVNTEIFRAVRGEMQELTNAAKDVSGQIVDKSEKIVPEQPFLEDDKLDRDEILKEIERIEKIEENLVPSVGETIPDADTEVKDEPVDAKKVEEVVEEVKPVYKVDPYREPIE